MRGSELYKPERSEAIERNVIRVTDKSKDDLNDEPEVVEHVTTSRLPVAETTTSRDTTSNNNTTSAVDMRQQASLVDVKSELNMEQVEEGADMVKHVDEKVEIMTNERETTTQTPPMMYPEVFTQIPDIQSTVTVRIKYFLI